jgi:hypothetical protein
VCTRASPDRDMAPCNPRSDKMMPDNQMDELRAEQERLLHKALQETLPASDPISVQQANMIGGFGRWADIGTNQPQSCPRSSGKCERGLPIRGDRLSQRGHEISFRSRNLPLAPSMLKHGARNPEMPPPHFLYFCPPRHGQSVLRPIFRVIP